MTSFRSQFFVTASSRESSESIPLLETRNALKIMNYNLLLAYRGVPRKRAPPPPANNIIRCINQFIYFKWQVHQKPRIAQATKVDINIDRLHQNSPLRPEELVKLSCYSGFEIPILLLISLLPRIEQTPSNNCLRCHENKYFQNNIYCKEQQLQMF